jgi:hypothetical protein
MFGNGTGGFEKSGGGGASGGGSIQGTGRNFNALTQYNQLHNFKNVKEAMMAFLFPPQPPTAAIAGAFILDNSAGAYVSFATLERGTLVSSVRLTVSGTQGANGQHVKYLRLTGGGISPNVFTIDPTAAGKTTDRIAYDNSAFTLNTAKSYSLQSEAADGVLSTSAPATWAFGVRSYMGVGKKTGAQIDEAFIRSLINKTNIGVGIQASVTQTPASDEYIYYVYPTALFGTGGKPYVFKFLGADQTNPEEALRIKVRTDAEVRNGTLQSHSSVTEYAVIRSLTAGLGSGSAYTFSVGLKS